jgi:hypothetical protein
VRVGKGIKLSEEYRGSGRWIRNFHATQAEAYRLLGQLDGAVNCCRTAQRLNPNLPEAINTSGLV